MFTHGHTPNHSLASNSSKKARVALVGIGNCASSLVQGVTYYGGARLNDPPPGIMHLDVGGYKIDDIQFSAAFDVNRTKVGRDLGEAIFAEPNNTHTFAEIAPTGVKVARGPTLDGIGVYAKSVITESTEPPAD